MDRLQQLVISNVGRGKINALHDKKNNWLGNLVKREELSSFEMAQEWAYSKFYKNPEKAIEYVELFKSWFKMTDKKIACKHARSIDDLCNIEVQFQNKNIYIK